MAPPGRDQVRFAFQIGLDGQKALDAVLAASGTGFSPDGAEALADAVAPLWAGSRDRIAEVLAAATGPTALFVAARLAQQDGRRDEALAQFKALAAALPVPDAGVQIYIGRVATALGKMAEAVAAVRLGLSLDPSYGLHLKAEKLVRSLMRSPEWQPSRHLRLAILGTSTTALLAGPLVNACFRAGIAVELYQGAHGAWRQEILDPSSALHAFAPQAAILLVNSRDLALPPDGGRERMAEFCADLRHAWAELRVRHDCHIIQVGFDRPGEGAWGTLEDQLPQGRRRVVDDANRILADDPPPGVVFLHPGRAASLLGGAFVSEREWMRSRQYPAVEALPLLADLIVAQCRAFLGLSAKVLALDLDNTLWGGVIAEDGIAGIVLGPPDPMGEAYQALQDHALELKARGVILAVCSKNNVADAQLPFREHDAMRLRLDDVVVFRANWDDKAANLSEVARQLDLGLDSIVFLDDNPVERAWVRDRLPQVTVVEGGSDPWTMRAALERGFHFETVALTEDDRNRHGSYRARAELANLRQGGSTVEDFLADLGMTCHHGPVDTLTLSRTAQLIAKTNQFNLTTPRYSLGEVGDMAASSEWWCRWFRLADRFGDHGLTGLLFARRGETAWEIDTWLMSCRVLGRRMEDFMLGRLLAAAGDAGAVQVRARYLPTAKNAPVADLLPRLGFVAGGGEGEYVWDIARPAAPCPFIAEGGADAPC